LQAVYPQDGGRLISFSKLAVTGQKSVTFDSVKSHRDFILRGWSRNLLSPN